MMGKTILIAEDELKMRKLLVDYIEHEGYATIEASNGQEALNKLNAHHVDLLIVDVMMPFLDGFEVCRSVRSSSDVPIVVLTAKAEEYDKLTGYELGADDYVTKPFSPKVLMAKIRALFKRIDSELASSSALVDDTVAVKLDGLEFRSDSNEIRLDGTAVALTRKEYELLMYLYRNRNRTLSREQILDQVWGFDYEGDARTVDTHVRRLRHKLAQCADYVVTVKGFGYMFKAVKR